MFAWAYCNSLLNPAHVDRLMYLKCALGLELKQSLTALAIERFRAVAVRDDPPAADLGKPLVARHHIAIFVPSFCVPLLPVRLWQNATSSPTVMLRLRTS
jgi:hypothetical protein